jgi:hypothetical protein
LAGFSILGFGGVYLAGDKERVLEVQSLRFVHSKPTAEKSFPARVGPFDRSAARLWLLWIMATIGWWRLGLVAMPLSCLTTVIARRAQAAAGASQRNATTTPGQRVRV